MKEEIKKYTFEEAIQRMEEIEKNVKEFALELQYIKRKIKEIKARRRVQHVKDKQVA